MSNDDLRTAVEVAQDAANDVRIISEVLDNTLDRIATALERIADAMEEAQST